LICKVESTEHSITEGDMPALNGLSLWGDIAAMALSDKGRHFSGFNKEVTFTPEIELIQPLTGNQDFSSANARRTGND